MAEDWSNIEIELIVADYFDMFNRESNGVSFSKTEHRKRLAPLLKKRSEGSIEFKHQNISAVLVKLGKPHIKGYKPRFNYQKILVEVIKNHLGSNIQLEQNFISFSDAPIVPKKIIGFETFVDKAPTIQNIVQEKEIEYNRLTKINYLEREQNNRSLGAYGEETVIQYEKWRLISIGKDSLADKIEWISKDQGDGAGFDILSKNEDGTDRYIEVKTTKLGKETPFFFSKNEFDFSKKNEKQFHLYRLFNFSDDPKMFIKDGAFDSFCNVEAINFRGTF